MTFDHSGTAGFQAGGPIPNFVLRNLTPHAISIAGVDGTVHLPAATSPPRVQAPTKSGSALISGVEIEMFSRGDAEIVGLPDQEVGVLLFVSQVILQLSDRSDLVAPAELIRDDAGAVVGARGLTWRRP